MYKIIIVVFALLLSSCAKRIQQPLNFIMNGQKQRVSWKFNQPVEMLIHRSFYDIDPNNPEVGREYIRLVYKAASAWERRVGLRLFSIREDRNHYAQNTNSAQNDGVSVIYWMKEWNQNRRKEQARTSNRWVGSEIIEADVAINNRHHALYGSVCSSSSRDLASRFCEEDIEDSAGSSGIEKSEVHFVSLMIHELGHVLGQGHAKERNSVMQPVLRSDEIRDIITSLDAERVQEEYTI